MKLKGPTDNDGISCRIRKQYKMRSWVFCLNYPLLFIVWTLLWSLFQHAPFFIPTDTNRDMEWLISTCKQGFHFVSCVLKRTSVQYQLLQSRNCQKKVITNSRDRATLTLLCSFFVSFPFLGRKILWFLLFDLGGAWVPSALTDFKKRYRHTILVLLTIYF